MKNITLIEKTVEITVAKLSSCASAASKNTGEDVAEFMQEIYNKLVELNNSKED